MEVLPGHLISYATTKTFTQDTIPENLTKEHDTKQGVWALIHVVKGELDYTILGDAPETVALSKDVRGVVSPTVKHFITPRGAVEVYIEFFRE